MTALTEPVTDVRRWWALIAIAVAQLMLAIDTTIMNLALPSAQQALGLSAVERQWVINAFALAFGGLLLLGGRVSDLLGRRRTLLIGLAGFTLASVLGGFATNPESLLGARFLQGVFGALITPSVLAVLSISFPQPLDRARAFGIYGTIMGSGSGIGVILGGVLTDYLSWRWAMFVNVPIALIAAAGVAWSVRADRAQAVVRPGLFGALLGTAGLLAVVYGLTMAGESGWGVGLPPLVIGLALLGLFVWIQHRAVAPLLPLRLLGNRRRVAAYVGMASWASGVFVTFLLVSFHLQSTLGLSPVRTGLTFLPFTAAIMIGLRVVRPLSDRFGVRSLFVAGLLSVSASLVLLSQLDAQGNYLVQVLPIFLLQGLGAAAVLPAANSTATLGAGPDTGVAGAMAATSQQVGAALGIAILGSLASGAGYERAGLVGAVWLVVAAAGVYAISGRPSQAK
ncbi:MFS transporter [Kribbella deserti]|uniref:MFS transporter n=1 Tax=Kribbella deserti TaxID=1926257 RepID=A0ABV6QHT5_9ACTN